MYYELLILLQLIFAAPFCYCCIEKYDTCGCKNIKEGRLESLKGKGKSKDIQGKRLECSQIDVAGMFADAELPEDSVVLSLTNNVLREVSNATFGSRPETLNILKQVKRLDLSQNQIARVYRYAFVSFSNLARLNLSRNSIGRLSRDMFFGLPSLEHIDLSRNLFPIIPGDIFLHTPMMKKIVVKENDLVCNCLMQPFIDWVRNRSREVRGEGRETPMKVQGTCTIPARFMGTDLRSLKTQDLVCGPNHTLDRLPHFRMEPSNSQLVFEGDELPMLCEGTDLENTEILWSYNGSRIQDTALSSFSTNTSRYHYRTVVSGSLKIRNLTVEHSGPWKCTIASKYGSESRTFHLLVVKQNPGYCEFDAVENMKGTFEWPEIVTGVTAALRCPVNHRDSGYNVARRVCQVPGVWASGRYHNCLYKDIVAQLVHDTLAAKLTPQNVLQIIKKLVSSLQTEVLQEPYSVELIADLSERLIKFASNTSKENDIGSQMLQLASFVMNADPSVLRKSSAVPSACERILRVVRTLALKIASTSFVKKLSPSIAVIGFKLTDKSQFGLDENDMICEIGSTDEMSLEFSCTMTSTPKMPPRSFIQIPSTMLQSYTKETADEYKLYLIVYRNGNLFLPRTGSETSNATEPTSQHSVLSQNIVIEAGVNGGPVVNLTESAMFGFVTPNASFRTAAHWSATDGWVKDESCVVRMSYQKNQTLLVCSQLTNITLLYDPDSENTSGGKGLTLSSLAHPAVLIGTGVFMIFLITVIFSYICCYAKLGITSDARHMLINICVHLALAACTFALGIWRVDNKVLCPACGIILHYSSLSVLLWIAISARNIHHEMIVHSAPPSLEPKPKRPMLRFYLIGCGIPAVVCGITAAAKMQNYYGDNGKYCWLSWETSVFAFYLPAAVIAVICIILLIRMLCALNRATAASVVARSPLSNVRAASNGCSYTNHEHFDDMYCGDVTENTPLQYADASPHGNSSGREGASSLMQSQPDNEQSYGARLRGVSLLLFFFLATWVAAAISVAAPSFEDKSALSDSLSPFHASSHQHLDLTSSMGAGQGSNLGNIFSCLYAVLAIATGLFLVIQHLACQRDVRACWVSAWKGTGGSSEQHNLANSQTSTTALRNAEAASTVDGGQDSRVCTPPYDKTSHRSRKLHQGDLLPALPSDPSMLDNILHSSRIEEKQNSSRVASANGSFRQHRPPEHSWHTPHSSIHMQSHSSRQYQQHHRRDINGMRHPYHSHSSMHSGHRHIHGVPPQAYHTHMDSSSARVYSQPVYSHDPCIAGSQAYKHGSAYGRHHHSQRSHVQSNGNPVKMTNLLMAHDSSMTEHSFDEVTHNNMHTIPVIMQQHSQPKVDNSLLYYRYQKMRKVLDRKKSKQNKLMVLREYAQDPLTSNDEDTSKTQNKTDGVEESSPLLSGGMKNNLLRDCSNLNKGSVLDGQRNEVSALSSKYKPLLIASPPGKKKNVNHSRTHVPGQARRNRSTERGGKNNSAATRGSKHRKRRSGNSTLSERERDTTSSEKTDAHIPEAPIRQVNSESVLFPEQTPASEVQKQSTPEKDNHGYLTLQQLMSINSFLPVKSKPSTDPETPDENKDFSFEALENESLSPSLCSSMLIKRNETSV